MYYHRDHRGNFAIRRRYERVNDYESLLSSMLEREFYALYRELYALYRETFALYRELYALKRESFAIFIQIYPEKIGSIMYLRQ